MLSYFLFTALLTGPIEPADVPAPLYLWPDGAPGAVGSEEVDKPCVFVYHASDETRTGASIVVCPGGGYGGHAMDYEGHHIARYYQSRGVTAALLRYRLGERYRHPAPLQDVSRAIRTLRQNSAEWNLDSDRVGVIGFSAGGHLASTVATHFDAGDPSSDDPIARQSSRPSFVMLCYPVVSFSAPYSHSGSAKRLLGPNPTNEQLRELSNELHVTADSPPAFLFHTGGDTVVPPQNSIAYAMACAEHGVPCELHLFRHGPHGVGMAQKDIAASHWPELTMIWLRQMGLLTDKPPAAVRGSVTLDGKPVPSGEIVFVPEDPNAPRASTRFGGGKFAFSADSAPTIGKAHVEILHNGNFSTLPSTERAVDVAPPGTLTVQIIEGDNDFQFNLTTTD